MVRIRPALGLALGGVLIVAACSGAATPSPTPTSAAPTSAATSAATAAATTTLAPVTIGFSMYVINTPFAQDVVRGAKDAAADLSVNLLVGGPTAFDPVAVGTSLEQQVSAGAQAVFAPGSVGIGKILNEIQASGKLIGEINDLDPTLKTFYVGEAAVNSGRILAKQIIDKLGGPSAATGNVLIGTCVPGLAALEYRITGIKQGLVAAPGLKIIGVFGTDPDESKNYPIYEQQLATHPDVNVFFGTCSTDTVSIGKLKTSSGANFIGGGYDITPETLAAVNNGSVYVSLGQGAYLQGYLPVRILADSLRTGKPVPVGFINSGTEPVTSATVATFLGFYQSGSHSIHEYYKPQETEDYTTLIEPFTGVYE